MRYLSIIICLALCCVGQSYAQSKTSQVEQHFKAGETYFEKKDYANALSLFEKSANAGNTSGMLYAGYCYEKGLGTAINLEKAEYWYTTGSNKGNHGCTRYLADMLYKGHENTADLSRVFSLYEKAANNGISQAQYSLARFFYDGLTPCEKNYATYLSWIEKSAAGGYSSAQYELGLLYGRGLLVGRDLILQMDLKKAVEWFEKAADQQYTWAICKLGDSYLRGIGVTRDEHKAYNLFLRALELGNESADVLVGICLENGYGVEMDKSKAFHHYMIRANKGDMNAQYIVGTCYEYGIGVTRDTEAATVWYEKSLRQGHEQAESQLKTMKLLKIVSEKSCKTAIYKLGQISSDAHLVLLRKTENVIAFVLEPDEEKSIARYQQIIEESAKQGNIEAQTFLGKAYYNGNNGYPQSYSKALAYLSKPVQKDAESQYYMGKMYLYGEGVKKKDIKLAFDFLSQSARSYKKANELLALCYLDGLGTKKNISEAIACYEKAGMKNEALSLKEKNGLLTGEDLRTKAYGCFNNSEYDMAFRYFSEADKKGDYESTMMLGFMHRHGVATPANETKAFELFEKAAPHNTNARIMVAQCYLYGEGIPQDATKGFSMLQKLEREKEAVYSEIGDCYMDGLGVAKSPQMGVSYYLKGAEAGDLVSMNNLGWAYLHGSGVPKNATIAIGWLQKAAENGNNPANSNLGLCYFLGMGVVRDYSKAIEYFSKADNGSGYNRLGLCYLLGKGAPQSYREAVTMFERAIADGNKEAYFNLALCYELGLGVNADKSKAVEYMKQANDRYQTLYISTNKLDPDGKWVPATLINPNNCQNVYTLKKYDGLFDEKAIVSIVTNNNISQRKLSYIMRDGTRYDMELPPVFLSSSDIIHENIATKLPVVKIINPVNGSYFDTPNVAIKYYIDTPIDAPVMDMIVSVNGELQPKLTSRSAKPGESYPLTLPRQDCRVTVQARNKFGYGETAVLDLKWDKGTYGIIQPTLYVLAIGIDNYDNFSTLKFAVKDMKDFVAAVERKKGKLYKDVVIKNYSDRNATKHNIEEGLLWLAEEATDADVAFIYFAGHGEKDEKERFYFIPVDGARDRLPITAIRGSYFAELIKDIHGKVVVFADACHSGAILDGRRGTSDGDMDEVVDLLRQAKNGITIYTSSDSDTVSSENPEWGNGVFTKVLLEALNGNARDVNKKALTTYDLMNYLNERVKTFVKTQKPKFAVNEDFPLFLY